MAAALEIKNLHAWYGESHILHGVDLHVNEGEVVTLLGRNGAGRTTTLRAIMGLTGTRKGSIQVNGTETIGMATHRGRPPRHRLLPEERGDLRQPLLRGEPDAAAARRGRGRHEHRRDLRNVPEPAGAGPRARAPACRGASRQMLAVARILRTGAHLLLLDEISEGLAAVIVAKLGEMIRMLKAKGYTVVMVEQNFRFAALWPTVSMSWSTDASSKPSPRPSCGRRKPRCTNSLESDQPTLPIEEETT